MLTRRKGESIQDYRARVDAADKKRIDSANSFIAKANQRIKKLNSDTQMSPEEQKKAALVKSLDKILPNSMKVPKTHIGKIENDPTGELARRKSVADRTGSIVSVITGKKKQN